jgi:hypothetical protein
MKYLRALGIATFAATLALSGAALAQNGDAGTEPDETVGDTSPGSPLEDATGFSVLGIDIGPAGSSTESVQAFVAGLSAEQQNGINTTCQNLVSGTDTTAVHENVTNFCQLLLGTM